MAEISERLNLSLMEKELSREGLEPPGELGWLEESYRNPAAFWQALMGAQDRFLSWPRKSLPLRKYDFYHDLITRHQRNPAPALCWYEAVSGWHELSYPQLGVLATQRAAAWRRAGVQPGQTLCLLYPFGVSYVVSLVAALKIGLRVSLLPPQGRGFLRRRLEALVPDHIATEEISSSLLPDWQDHLLSEGPLAERLPLDFERSYTYPAGGVVGLCFDPSSPTPHIPRELTSDAAYLWALRDGMIALGLRPGQTVAAPGFHLLETQPALLLASLLNGGTYLHVALEDLAKDPKLLAVYPIQAMGVTNQLRDLLLRRPVEMERPWGYWFRNPAESIDVESWQAFIRASRLEEAFAGNLRWNAALGGCLLFSVRRKGRAHQQVLPSAGVPWGLTDLSGGGWESLGDWGIFSLAASGEPQEEESTPTGSILARSRKEWLFVKAYGPGRAGRTYPQEEILETLQAIPGCARSSIVEVPASGTDGDSLFAVLIFTGARTGVDEAGIGQAIRTRIEREMGREFLPDRTQFFPLHPRCGPEGTIDHAWCRAQYLTGGLFRKSRGEIYRCLAQLQDAISQARP